MKLTIEEKKEAARKIIEEKIKQYKDISTESADIKYQQYNKLKCFKMQYSNVIAVVWLNLPQHLQQFIDYYQLTIEDAASDNLLTTHNFNRYTFRQYYDVIDKSYVMLDLYFFDNELQQLIFAKDANIYSYFVGLLDYDRLKIFNHEVDAIPTVFKTEIEHQIYNANIEILKDYVNFLFYDETDITPRKRKAASIVDTTITNQFSFNTLTDFISIVQKLHLNQGKIINAQDLQHNHNYRENGHLNKSITQIAPQKKDLAALECRDALPIKYNLVNSSLNVEAATTTSNLVQKYMPLALDILKRKITNLTEQERTILIADITKGTESLPSPRYTINFADYLADLEAQKETEVNRTRAKKELIDALDAFRCITFNETYKNKHYIYSILDGMIVTEKTLTIVFNPIFIHRVLNTQSTCTALSIDAARLLSQTNSPRSDNYSKIANKLANMLGMNEGVREMTLAGLYKDLSLDGQIYDIDNCEPKRCYRNALKIFNKLKDDKIISSYLFVGGQEPKKRKDLQQDGITIQFIKHSGLNLSAREQINAAKQTKQKKKH